MIVKEALMNEPDLKAEIESLKLTTKAAKLRQLMPVIEARLAEGVRAAEIVDALNRGGLELSIGTFRNYLHQYRAKKSKSTRQQASQGTARLTGAPLTEQSGVPAELETPLPTSTSNEPVSPQELARLMKPDPAKQAEDLARYERLAKQQRRSRKP